MKPMNIAVLMGGASSEREVSLRSGAAVALALQSRGHRVTSVDMTTPDGRELEGLACDVAFIAMHGKFGEDGGVQKLLDRRGVPFTGSGPDSSRAAMDKIESKRLFKLRGIETPPHRVIARGDSPELFERSARALGYPVVIKPRAEGSSVGVTIHPDLSALFEGAIEAFRYDSIALMEKFIAGREMTVGVLDDEALPIIELKPRRAFFDFIAKYQDPDTIYVVDPSISELDKRRIQKVALEAHRALGCAGMSRVDLIFTPLHGVMVLEVNSIPGLTERSLLPKAAKAAGIGFPTLCERIVQSAFKRDKGFVSGWAAAML